MTHFGSLGMILHWSNCCNWQVMLKIPQMEQSKPSRQAWQLVTLGICCYFSPAPPVGGKGHFSMTLRTWKLAEKGMAEMPLQRDLAAQARWAFISDPAF